jgi:uncharacterized protein YjiS (DUF1127 family)
MFEFETSIARPSAYELHLRARRERNQAINHLSRHAVSKFADWLCMLAYNGGVRLARQLAAERRLRRDIGALRRLEDRELADLGLGRSEIEHVVRGGRRSRATEAPLHRRIPAQRQESPSA